MEGRNPTFYRANAYQEGYVDLYAVCQCSEDWRIPRQERLRTTSKLYIVPILRHHKHGTNCQVTRFRSIHKLIDSLSKAMTLTSSIQFIDDVIPPT
jgi:hypothetical protein